MRNRCLYCYDELREERDFHEKCSLSFFGSREAPRIHYTISQMSELAMNIVERSISVPGVQPKLSMSMVDDAINKNGKRLTVVGALGGNYILKPPSETFAELPQNEHISMRIAESFGIRVVPSSLIKLQSGELSYITKRIDRLENGTKIHMLDMFQIQEAYDKYRGSMEKIGNNIGEYSANPLLDKLRFFELSLFCFLIGNNDMHLKNFSMIHSSNGWILAPSYDLLNVSIAIPDDTEELALTMAGKKNKFKLSHFEQFGLGLGLNTKQIDAALKRMQNNKPKAIAWIGRSFLSEDMKNKYNAVLEERYARLFADGKSN